MVIKEWYKWIGLGIAAALAITSGVWLAYATQPNVRTPKLHIITPTPRPERPRHSPEPTTAPSTSDPNPEDPEPEEHGNSDPGNSGNSGRGNSGSSEEPKPDPEPKPTQPPEPTPEPTETASTTDL